MFADQEEKVIVAKAAAKPVGDSAKSSGGLCVKVFFYLPLFLFIYYRANPPLTYSLSSPAVIVAILGVIGAIAYNFFYKH